MSQLIRARRLAAWYASASFRRLDALSDETPITWESNAVALAVLPGMGSRYLHMSYRDSPRREAVTAVAATVGTRLSPRLRHGTGSMNAKTARAPRRKVRRGVWLALRRRTTGPFLALRSRSYGRGCQ